MPYGVKVLLDGADITDKVSKLEIISKLDTYCRELSLDIADPDLYDTIDFSVLPTAPALEVQTRVDTDWVSQGLFFIEKPTYQVGIHSTRTGLWGRSTTALLGPPFAVKITRTWDLDTTFFAIAAELLEACGLTWDPSYSDVNDFLVHGRTYQAELKHPVEVLKELMQLAYGDDAFVTTDAGGHVCLKKTDRAPALADHTITDPIAVEISEDPEWPDFGNRIRISSAGSLSGYSVRLEAPSSCLSADTETRGKLYARVTDSDGIAVQDIPVNWSSLHDLVTFDEPTTNTQTVYFEEQVRAKNFYEVEVQFAPSQVVNVFAYRDFYKTDDISDGGYTIDGNTIRLTSKLQFCDQMLVVSYLADGVAVNWMSAGSTAGTDKVSAEVAGNVATQDVYLDNPCNCPANLSLRADPSSIEVGESSSLLAYVEIGGAPVRDGRLVWMTVDSFPSHGHIDWMRAYLGKVIITNEETQAQNVISGVTQCEIAMFPASVTGVWRTTQDSDGNLTKIGGSIYGSHVQKVINFTEYCSTGERLLVDYVAVGAASNIYTGLAAGSDVIRAIIRTTREEPTEATVSISVSNPSGPDRGGSLDEPDGCCSDGLCQQDGSTCGSETVTCEEGKVWGARDGVYGCHAASECDVCEEGKITCTKDGEPGCYASNECDTEGQDGGTGKVYANVDGTDGCYAPDSLESCASGKVNCYKGGTLGCWPVEECDTSFGAKTSECPPGTQCCQHKETEANGCFAPSDCKDQAGSGGKGDHDKSPDTKCKRADGSAVTCSEGKTCCEKGGKRDCYPSNECDGGGGGCTTTPCQDDPNPDCVSGRFGATKHGCSCDELCEDEFSKYGTIQSYDGGSYRTFEQIVEEDYGLSPDTAAYWEQYGKIREEAFAECKEACGTCAESVAPSISGSDAVTAPGGYQYTATGGLTPYTWEVSGTGATISDDGFVTLEAGACGSYTVTVTDACGGSATMDARVTNNGKWSVVYQNGSCPCYVVSIFECIIGKYKHSGATAGHLWTNNPCGCPELEDHCGVWTGNDYGFVQRLLSQEWVCP